MANVRDRTFDYEGRTITIQVKLEGDEWNGRAFEKGKPESNVFFGSVTKEVVEDAASSNQDPIKELLNVLESDIRRGHLQVP